MFGQNLIPTRFTSVTLDAPLGSNCIGLVFGAGGTVRVEGVNNVSGAYATITVVAGQTLPGRFRKVVTGGTVAAADIMACHDQ